MCYTEIYQIVLESVNKCGLYNETDIFNELKTNLGRFTKSVIENRLKTNLSWLLDKYTMLSKYPNQPPVPHLLIGDIIEDFSAYLEFRKKNDSCFQYYPQFVSSKDLSNLGKTAILDFSILSNRFVDGLELHFSGQYDHNVNADLNTKGTMRSPFIIQDKQRRFGYITIENPLMEGWNTIYQKDGAESWIIFGSLSYEDALKSNIINAKYILCC